jgi:hypothetical protein
VVIVFIDHFPNLQNRFIRLCDCAKAKFLFCMTFTTRTFRLGLMAEEADMKFVLETLLELEDDLNTAAEGWELPTLYAVIDCGSTKTNTPTIGMKRKSSGMSLLLGRRLRPAVSGAR